MPVYPGKKAKSCLLTHLQKSSYKSLSLEVELLSFILNNQKELNADNYSKVVLFLVDSTQLNMDSLERLKVEVEKIKNKYPQKALLTIFNKKDKLEAIALLVTVLYVPADDHRHHRSTQCA
mgnify:CR=1 FL=1